ncbi:putative phosphatase regulatory subunit-domain-containing protein [Russula vinacea]|nr:putative phosphatase regulatory subunit-domain-containing protein [Russula vinacea]
MASTVSTNHDYPPTRDIHWSRNVPATPLSRNPRRLASAEFPTTLISPNSNPASAPTATAGFSYNARPTPTPDVTLSRDLSESPAVVAQSAPTPPLHRKRSGEPLKPSLKLKSSRGSLTINTGGVDSSSSKSAPATPTHKGVRFHPELEHVKYFLAEQKPLAVSCDGSPSDASGTDSEFPLFIHPRDDDLKGRPLVMHRIDVPIASSMAEDTCDIAVENIDLVGTTVEGSIRVRNLAFNKCIAVYFTFDHWETTSEVTARYKESLPDGTFDWFMFSIKLADVLSRAQEKTMHLAVRYAVSGREIWDNNGGRNYQVRIVHKKALKLNKRPWLRVARSLSKMISIISWIYGDSLRSIVSHESRRRWDSLSPTPSPPARDGTPSSTVEGFFAARCDIPASSRCPPSATRQIPFRARANTHPSARPDKVSSFFPDRDPDDSDHDSDDGSATLPSRRRQRSGVRNHTRVQYSVPLPLPDPTSARPQTQPDARFNSFPPHSSQKQPLQTQVSRDENAISTTSGTSSCSRSSSPSSSAAELVSPTRLSMLDMDENRNSPIQCLDYHNIVDRFQTSTTGRHWQHPNVLATSETPFVTPPAHGYMGRLWTTSINVAGPLHPPGARTHDAPSPHTTHTLRFTTNRVGRKKFGCVTCADYRPHSSHACHS